MKRIGVIGAGYVGQGMIDLFRDHFVISVFDPAKGHHNEDGVMKSDLILICVPTPMSPDGSADVSIVQETIEKFRETKALVCIKSTVPPGTTDRLNDKYQMGGRIHFSPEYMGEGKNFTAPWKYPDPRNARSHSFAIVGGPRASQVMDYFQTVMATDAHYAVCSALEAELTKYMENTWLAMKVAFCSEWSLITKQYGIDYKRVRELWLLDPRVGRDHTLVFSALGFNGKCLPKDLAAINAEMVKRGFTPGLLAALQVVNDRWHS